MTRNQRKQFLFIWIAIILIVLIAAISRIPVVEVRYSPRASETTDVRILTQAIIAHAERISSLPEHLEDLSDPNIDYLILDQFIYVGPRGADASHLPSNTPLVIFPWEDGAHIGYLSGIVRFEPGGYQNGPSVELARHLRYFQFLFAFAVLAIIVLVFEMLRRRRQMKDGEALPRRSLSEPDGSHDDR